MAALTSACDVSSGTTIPGSTTSSSSGSTGSVSVSLINDLQSLSHTHSRKKSPPKFPAAFACSDQAERHPGSSLQTLVRHPDLPARPLFMIMEIAATPAALEASAGAFVTRGT
jgi:hypothetical protein